MKMMGLAVSRTGICVCLMVFSAANSNVALAKRTEFAWPALQRWAESLDSGLRALPRGGFDGGEVVRQARLLTDPEDITAARQRLKLTEGLLNATPGYSATRRYIGGGDETCEWTSRARLEEVLDRVRRRIGVKHVAVPAQILSEATRELRAVHLREGFWICESVLLDDSDHDRPVYLQGFQLHPQALVLVETLWW